MNRIKTEHTLHNGKVAVKLIFGYDAAAHYATFLMEAGVNLRYVRTFWDIGISKQPKFIFM